MQQSRCFGKSIIDTTGTLNIETDPIGIETDPIGAEVLVNNVYKGDTPLELNMPLGEYRILLKKDNYTSVNETIQLKKGKTAHVKHDLVKPLASLRLNTKPSGAVIFINGIERGETPTTIKGLKAGEYRIALLLKGYKDWKKDVQIIAETNQGIPTITLERLNLIGMKMPISEKKLIKYQNTKQTDTVTQAEKIRQFLERYLHVLKQGDIKRLLTYYAIG